MLIVAIGFSKIFTLLTMFFGMRAMENVYLPYPHNPPVVEGYSTEFAAPARSTFFNFFEAASSNEKLKNTKYMFAYLNGKSGARVCTDLTQAAFESALQVTDIMTESENGFGTESIIARHIDTLTG